MSEAAPSILLKPGLALSVTSRSETDGAVSWTAFASYLGHAATRDGFTLRSQAFTWACEQAGQFNLIAA